jgi:hypothetical protein
MSHIQGKVLRKGRGEYYQAMPGSILLFPLSKKEAVISNEMRDLMIGERLY